MFDIFSYTFPCSHKNTEFIKQENEVETLFCHDCEDIIYAMPGYMFSLDLATEPQEEPPIELEEEWLRSELEVDYSYKLNLADFPKEKAN